MLFRSTGNFIIKNHTKNLKKSHAELMVHHQYLCGGAVVDQRKGARTHEKYSQEIKSATVIGCSNGELIY